MATDPHISIMQTHDIVIGPENPEDHLKNKYTNTLIGRYTNRLPGGTHFLKKKTDEGEIECELKVEPNIGMSDFHS